MAEEPVKKEEVVESAEVGRQLVGHEKDLAQVKKDIDRCYIQGSDTFRKDVTNVISDTIQQDESRKRIKAYARESAEEVWNEKVATEKEKTWKSKNLWVPVIATLVGVILGAILTAYFTVKLTKQDQPNPTSITEPSG